MSLASYLAAPPRGRVMSGVYLSVPPSPCQGEAAAQNPRADERGDDEPTGAWFGSHFQDGAVRLVKQQVARCVCPDTCATPQRPCAARRRAKAEAVRGPARGAERATRPL